MIVLYVIIYMTTWWYVYHYLNLFNKWSHWILESLSKKLDQDHTVREWDLSLTVSKG